MINPSLIRPCFLGRGGGIVRGTFRFPWYHSICQVVSTIPGWFFLAISSIRRGMKPLEWLVDLKPEAMYGSALGFPSEWLPGEVRKHRLFFLGGQEDQYPSGKLTYPTWGKRNNIIYSKVPSKRGTCFFPRRVFWEMDWWWSMDSCCCWLDRFLAVICVLDEFYDLRICGLDGWITFRRCVFKNNRLIYNWCFETHIIIHIIITYLFILACSKYLV